MLVFRKMQEKLKNEETKWIYFCETLVRPLKVKYDCICDSQQFHEIFTKNLEITEKLNLTLCKSPPCEMYSNFHSC